MQTMLAFVMEFFSRTTIHGVRYITQRGRHWSERLFWMVAFGASVYFCVLTARSVLLHWKESPIQMQLMDTKTAITSIAFPTVVVCPDVKTHVDKLNVTYAKQIATESPKNFSHEELLQVHALAHICSNVLPKNDEFTQTFTDRSIYQIMENFSPNIDSMFNQCKWKREPTNCEIAFAPIFTERGLCFTFNALNSHDIYTDEVAVEMMSVSNQPNVSGWSLESGYSTEINGEAYPLRVFDVQQFGLEFSIRLAIEDMEPVCQDLFTGFTIHFHNPGEMTTSQEYVHNVFSRGVNIRIKPTLVVTSDGLRSYQPSIRQCYFSSETSLRFFKYYTLSNCETECLANFMNQECGCVKFSMPRDQNTRICGVMKIECYKIAELKFFSDDIVHGLRDEKARDFRMGCNCLPLCTSIKYELEIIRFGLKSFNIPKFEVGNVTIFFKNFEVETIHRSEKYSLADLLAIGGNLLGLFLGVSAISIIELAYYFTLRLFWSLRQWKGEIHIVAPINGKNESEKISRIRRIRNLIRDETLNFCSKTSIHGIVYITERGRHWTERFFWIVIVGLAFWLCGKSILNVWIEWKENPVTVGFDDKSFSLSSIPFPTVTLCPNFRVTPNAMSLDRVRDILTGSEGNLTNVEWEHIEALALICPKLLSGVALSKRFQFKPKFLNETIHRVIRSMSPSLDKTFSGRSAFLELTEAHTKFYTPIWTDEGICFSFNTLNSRDIYTEKMAPWTMIVKKVPSVSNWSLEDGYTDILFEKSHPIRAFDSRKNGLWTSMEVPKGIAKDLCQNDIIGFKLYLNVPGEISSSLQPFTQTPFYHSTKLYLTPTVIKTSDGLRKYAPNTRKCFFSSERRLRFFKMYTKNNCELECLANFIKNECGCVKFSMPRDNKTLICGAASIECSRLAEARLFGFDDIKNLDDQHARTFREKCNCLNACTSITYEADIFRSEIPNGFLLWVMFNGGQVKTLLQSESHTISSFLSICGGLFGLFLGVSALSIIDLFYHFSLRLFWTIRQQRTNTTDSKSMENINSNEKSLAQTLKTFFIDFCSNTTIDGVAHFTERGRHWSERLFWVIIVAASLYLCGTSIKDELFEWRKNPIKISLSDSPMPISTIPFPTITVCPEAITTQTMFTNVNKLIDILSKNPTNLTKAELSRVNALAFLCDKIGEKISTEKFLDKSLYDGIRDIAPPMMNTVYRCSWKRGNESCETILKPIITQFGLCYAFNALNSHEIYTEEVSQDMMMINGNPNISDWSLDSGYTDHSNKNTYPFRAFGSNKNSLDISVEYVPKRDRFCQSTYSMFRVIVGMPGEMVPPFFLNNVKVIKWAKAQIFIKPTLITTADDLRSYDPITRQCFFDDERQLQFFRLYTEYNCQTECLSNFMKQECDCVEYFMPRDNTTKICGRNNCFKRVQLALFGDDIDEMKDKNAQTFRMNCNCLPACTTIKYDIDIDRPKVNLKMWTSWKPKFQSPTSRSTVNIFFKDYEIMSIKWMKSNSLVDFLVTCGGLLGLLLGMSALSVIEIIYFPTLRLFWALLGRSSNNGKAAIKPRVTIAFIPTNDKNIAYIP